MFSVCFTLPGSNQLGLSTGMTMPFLSAPQVSVTNVGICAQYGMVALQDIAERECLFEIPRSLLLTPQNSSIGHLLEEGRLFFAITCLIKFSPQIQCTSKFDTVRHVSKCYQLSQKHAYPLLFVYKCIDL